jgi:hypothetical protein
LFLGVQQNIRFYLSLGKNASFFTATFWGESDAIYRGRNGGVLIVENARGERAAKDWWPREKTELGLKKT